MNELAIDLRSVSTPSRWAWLAAGLLGVVVVALVATAIAGERTLVQRETELADLRAQLSQPQVSTPAPPHKMPYDSSAREFLAQATSQWPQMLSALESVELVGVTPISVDVSPAEHTVHVDVEFTDYPTLLRYVEALNAGEATPRWMLLQAQVLNRTLAVGIGSQSVASLQGSW